MRGRGGSTRDHHPLAPRVPEPATTFRKLLIEIEIVIQESGRGRFCSFSREEFTS